MYVKVRDKTKGEGRMYLDGDLLIQENFTFKRDDLLRSVLIGQEAFQVTKYLTLLCFISDSSYLGSLFV